MTRLIPIALMLTSAAATSATAQPGERRFVTGRFDAVDLASSDAIRIVAGGGFSVTASGDPRAIASLAITVRGDTLHVDRTPGRHSDKGATIIVTMPALRAATLSGSGSIRADHITGPAFVGHLGGSGGITVTDMKVGKASFDLDGSGAIVAEGAAEAVTIDLGGSGRIDTRRLSTRAVTADLSGSGSIDAVATNIAAIRAGGSGGVRVTGGARCDVRKGAAAVVRCG